MHCMIREFQTLLKIKNIYYMIPLIDLKNKSIGIDGDYFIRKYVDTSFKFKFDSLNLNKINIEKLFKYFNSLNIKILWVWGNTSLNCFKCTIPISEDINSILNCNYKIKEKDTSLEYRVSKRTFIDNLLLKYNIDVIKSPGMASAQLVNACTLNIINYIFSDEETLLLDRCGLLITNLDPIFSNKTSVPVLIKSQILSTLGIGGKLFSYLCMSLGNLYCPTHPLFRYNFNPLKVFKFVIENMNTFSKLKESCNLSANNLISTNKVICNSEYHIWFMKFLYAENIFYKVLIFHEDYIGCLNNIPDCRSAFFGGELFTFNSINPFYNEIINKPIECTLCHKNLYTDLLKGINLLINKFEEFIPKKYLTKLLIKGNQLTLEIKRNKKEQVSYLLQLIKIIICTNTDDLKLNPAYKLMIALMY